MKDWSVDVDLASAVEGYKLGEMLLNQPDGVLEALQPYGAAFSSMKDEEISVLMTVRAATVAGAAMKAIEAVESLATPVQVLRIEIRPYSELEAENERSQEVTLVGLAEVAEMAGLTKQAASGLVKTPRFPRPIAKLRSGPVWSLDDDLREAIAVPRRPGRKPKPTAN